MASTTSTLCPPPPPPPPLAELRIADSHFLGFCFPVDATGAVGCDSGAYEIQKNLKSNHSSAAHVPIAWATKTAVRSPPSTADKNESDTVKSISAAVSPAAVGWDEDGEPENSVGPAILSELERFLAAAAAENAEEDKDDDRGVIKNGSCGLVVVVVRYFGERLLGVTCGRLTGLYRSMARTTLHRYYFPDRPEVVDFGATVRQSDGIKQNIYGMGAGDCELLLDVVDENDGDLARIKKELRFDGFVGAAGEELPRLQNLQADLSEGVAPVYRYPGNYNGSDWTTFEWSPTSLEMKRAVELRLKPLVNQTMNHCVTNYYRDGTDFIAHHGDKDLDLNREGVIVSLSLGDVRILELKRRAEPRDLVRVALPHRSMLVLGPNTNREWTHSILPKPESRSIRISLTMREVKTFQDLRTGRLFGQGVSAKSLTQVRTRQMLENAGCLALFCAGLSALTARPKSREDGGGISMMKTASLVGALAVGCASLRSLLRSIERNREERDARDFFSKRSASGNKY